MKVDKIGAPLSAESASPISVTASVFENPPVVVGSVQPVPTAEYVAHAHALTAELAAQSEMKVAVVLRSPAGTSRRACRAHYGA